MPKSKRSQTVSLTQTAKKTREHKASIIQEIRESIDEHETLYLFSHENMRSHYFKEVRMHFRESSRIFLGKNKLMQIALGTSLEDEYADNLRTVSKLITGSVGLLLTNKPNKEVEHYFSTFTGEDFARAGSTATQKVVINNNMLENFPVSMLEQFRSLGLLVEVLNGKVVLVGKTEHIICKEGDELSVEACKLLVQFGMKLADFKVDLVCRWAKSDGNIEEFGN